MDEIKKKERRLLKEGEGPRHFCPSDKDSQEECEEGKRDIEWE